MQPGAPDDRLASRSNRGSVVPEAERMARMRRQRSSRRRFVGVSLLIAALALIPVVANSSPIARAQNAPVLVVDDEQTANPDLQAVELTAADGIDTPGSELLLPEGFSASVVASGLQGPRFMAFDAAGNLLVADKDAGNVYRYAAAEDGVIEPSGEPPEPLIVGLNGPSSVAFFEAGDTTYLYVGETHEILRFPYDPDGAVGEAELVVPDLPTAGHSTRTVAFGEDGELYVSIGSSCNICDEEDDRRAAIMRYSPDGSDGERFAWGLRNAVGLA
ncbi:MAG: hypothetical protein QOJ59_2797, partial [Thermomicrobiales bacterium]|nr:hypothetical protein [Thermomicrobiales bacterium]